MYSSIVYLYQRSPVHITSSVVSFVLLARTINTPTLILNMGEDSRYTRLTELGAKENEKGTYTYAALARELDTS